MGLHLELLNGPLDGRTIELESEALWRQAGEGPLTFPWDAELGRPQARFYRQGDGWWLEAYPAAHGTYCVNRAGRIQGSVQLQGGDLLKASEVWLLVARID